MKAGMAIPIVLVGLLAGCTQPEGPPREEEPEVAVRSLTVEEFAPVFERMKADPAFAWSRTADRFTVSEHFYSLGDDWEGVSRSFRCRPEELRALGWDMFPSREKLTRVNAVYGPPQRQANGQLVVQLAVPASDVRYADYVFTLSGGRWLLSSTDLRYMQGPTDPIPPPPCPSAPAPDDTRSVRGDA